MSKSGFNIVVSCIFMLCANLVFGGPNSLFSPVGYPLIQSAEESLVSRNNVGTQDSVSSSNQPYKRGLTMIQPATQWREALPSGNGTIGALVYGSINEERVLFNHNELWYNGRVQDVPDMSAELPVVRKMLDEGKYKEANSHYQTVLRSKGYNPANSVYHPAFDMILTTEVDHLFEDYARTLNFETGEVEVKWADGDTRFSRRLFVSIPDKISVMSIKADKTNAVNGEVTLDIHDLKDAIDRNGLDFDPGFTYNTTVNGEFVEFRADGSGRGEFGGLLRVITKNGASKLSALNRKASIRYENADEVLLLIAVYANEKSETAIPRLKEQLLKLDADYEMLFSRHKKLHSERFNAMGINLNVSGNKTTPNEYLLLDAYQNTAPVELIEKLFNYGRYLLISSSTAGGYPANLQGIWNGDYQPPWGGLLGNNENLQISYWQALPGNLNESMMAFYDFFDSHIDEFKYNAKHLFGCRGIYVPPFMSPDTAIMRHTAPHVVHWTDAAGWMASFYYDYYLFTGDTDFLKNRAIPFMKEVALFYEDYIVKDKQGKNMFYPSQSPENWPSNIDIGGGRGPKVQINSTIAVAISKEIFTNLVSACELLGVEKEGVKRWKAQIASMPEYEINEDGAFKEWLHPDFKDNYEHRHQSHIYPLFPGLEITEESSPELYEACRVAIEKRLTIGLSSQTGWSLAHMANVYARLGNGDKALEALNILSRCCLGQNFFTYHNDWRKMGVTTRHVYGRTSPFQMDANFGIAAAVTEMLCSSNQNVVKVLSGLPSNWTEGDFHDISTRTGTLVSAKWDMNKGEINITLSAGRNTSFDLKLPGEIIMLNCSNPKTIGESDYGNNYRKVNLKEGEEITLEISVK
jgi:alpha-L-fucosidase 2